MPNLLVAIAREAGLLLTPLGVSLDSETHPLVEPGIMEWSSEAYAPVDAVIDLLDDAGLGDQAELLTMAQALATTLDEIGTAVEPLITDPESFDEIAAAAAVADALIALRTLLDQPAALPDPGRVIRLLLEHLLVRHLRAEHPLLAQVLVLLGVIDIRAVTERRPDQLRLDRLPGALTDPLGALLDTAAHPDRPGAIDLDLILRELQTLALALGHTVHRVSEPGGGPVGQRLTYPLAAPPGGSIDLMLGGHSATGDDSVTGLAARVLGTITGTTAIDLGGGWQLTFAGEGSAGTPGLVLGPGGISVDLDEGPPPTGRTSLTLGQPAAAITLLPGGPDALIQITGHGPAQQLTVEVTETGEVVVGIEQRVASAELTITPPPDGFLSALISEPASASFAPVLGFRSDTGFYLSAGGGLAVTLPLDIDLGGILAMDALHLALAPGEGGVRLEMRLDAAATLGPIGASVQGVGAALELAWQAGDGDAPVRAALAPLFPHGVGLSVEAGPVTGGGFVAYEEVSETEKRYVGGLELSFGELGISAFGVLDTWSGSGFRGSQARTSTSGGSTDNSTGGDSGWSLILFVSATFPAVQLGFGFTLNGVGGILGIHRDVDVDALLANLRAGTLRSLISPEDPATEGAALARRAGEVFPVRQGTHVIGPTVKLGWGTPTLVSLDLALVVTLPDPLRIIVMGSVHAALPLPEAAVVELNLDIVGILDVSASLLHIEGILRDSRVLTINLSGGFALRATWGETSSLAFSVGGLHPRALPPPGFPPLDRLSADLSVGSAVTVRLAGYLAVTSNTIQLGAQIDASFTGGGFHLSGGLGFDALVVFSPFSLEVDIRAWFEVRRGGSVLLEVRLEGSLRGPNAWEISGRASIKVLFFDVSVAVSETFGQRRELPASPVDAADRLRTALADPLCVAPDEAAPGARTPLVVLTDRAGLDPSAPLAITQKVVPLDVRLDQLDGRPLVSGTGHTFGLAGARLLEGSSPGQGQSLTLGGARTEQFAPGSIRDLDDNARLAAPAFEHMKAGAALDPAGLTETGTHLDADTGREVIVVDAPDDAPARTRTLRGPAAAGVRTGLTATRRSRAPMPGPLLVVEPEEWVALNPANGRASGAGTWSQAQSQVGANRSVLATADELTQIAGVGA